MARPLGIDILLAPPRVEMAEMVTTRDLEKALSLLRRVYNVVIIDTPTYINDTVLAFFDASDGVIEIVTNDATTLRNSRIMAETFTAIGYARDRRHYLVNRSDATGGVDPRTVAEQLGGEPEFHLVSDGRLVVEANNQGVPFVLVEPRAHISQEMTHIATSLLTTRVASAAGAR